LRFIFFFNLWVEQTVIQLKNKYIADYRTRNVKGTKKYNCGLYNLQYKFIFF